MLNDQDFGGWVIRGSIRHGKWMKCVLKLIHREAVREGSKCSKLMKFSLTPSARIENRVNIPFVSRLQLENLHIVRADSIILLEKHLKITKSGFFLNNKLWATWLSCCGSIYSAGKTFWTIFFVAQISNGLLTIR